MRKVQQTIATLFILFTTMASAQEASLTVKGKVYDKGTEEGVYNAEIRLFNNSGNVLKTTVTDLKGKYQLELESAVNHFRVEAIAKNYNQAEVLVKNKEQMIVVDFGLDQEISGEKVDFPIVYFDFNSSYLTTQAEEKLKQILAYLREDSTAKLRVNAHTDSRGTNNYSDWLSARRGQRVVDWLVKQGINASRIEEHHFGKTQLSNHCTEGVSCTGEQHRENRRCSFDIF